MALHWRRRKYQGEGFRELKEGQLLTTTNHLGVFILLLTTSVHQVCWLIHRYLMTTLGKSYGLALIAGEVENSENKSTRLKRSYLI